MQILLSACTGIVLEPLNDLSNCNSGVDPVENLGKEDAGKGCIKESPFDLHSEFA